MQEKGYYIEITQMNEMDTSENCTRSKWACFMYDGGVRLSTESAPNGPHTKTANENRHPLDMG
jgi:hypothetical protein